MTSGLMTLKGRSYHLDKIVMEHAKEQNVVRKTQNIEKRQEDDLEYLKVCFKADIAKKKQSVGSCEEMEQYKGHNCLFETNPA